MRSPCTCWCEFHAPTILIELFILSKNPFLSPCAYSLVPISKDINSSRRNTSLGKRKIYEVCPMAGHCSEGRPMSKISFDRHLIEADPLGSGRAPKWLLSACYGHRHFIWWLFDGTDRGQKSHSSIEGLRLTALDLLTIRRRADQVHQEGTDAAPPNKIRFGSFWICFFFLGTARVLRSIAAGLPQRREGLDTRAFPGWRVGRSRNLHTKILAGAARDHYSPAW